MNKAKICAISYLLAAIGFYLTSIAKFMNHNDVTGGVLSLVLGSDSINKFIYCEDYLSKENKQMKIGCAILAGGKSSRMGTDKAFLEYDGKQFITQIAEELSWFDERIIARGGNCGFTGGLEREWMVIPDIFPEHGPIGGLHAALSSCESDALFVVTCDMPLIESGLVRKLCAFMQKTDLREERVDAYDVIISVGDDGKVYPLCGVYRKSALSVLEEQILTDQNRVMAALRKLRVKYVTIDSPAESRQLANVNTPQEYEQLCNQK